MAYYGNPYMSSIRPPQPPMSMGWGYPGAPGMGWGGYQSVPYHAMPPKVAGGGVPMGMKAGLYSSQMALGTQAGLYSSAISVGTMPMSNMIYASAPALPNNRQAAPRKGTVGLMLWPKDDTQELAVTGTKDGSSAHASKIEVECPFPRCPLITVNCCLTLCD